MQRIAAIILLAGFLLGGSIGPTTHLVWMKSAGSMDHSVAEANLGKDQQQHGKHDQLGSSSNSSHQKASFAHANNAFFCEVLALLATQSISLTTEQTTQFFSSSKEIELPILYTFSGAETVVSTPARAPPVLV